MDVRGVWMWWRGGAVTMFCDRCGTGGADIARFTVRLEDNRDKDGDVPAAVYQLDERDESELTYRISDTIKRRCCQSCVGEIWDEFKKRLLRHDMGIIDKE